MSPLVKLRCLTRRRTVVVLRQAVERRGEWHMSEAGSGLQRKTNWWGAFVIGLAAPILVVGLDPPAIQALGAAAIPLLAGATAVGVLLCLFVAELAAVMPDRTGGVPYYTTAAFEPFGESISRHVGGLAAWSYWLGGVPGAPIKMILPAP